MIENPNIVAAPACPHYMPRDVYNTFLEELGEAAECAIKCEWCMETAPRVPRRFNQPGRPRQVRGSKRRDGLTPLERERFLRGRVA